MTAQTLPLTTNNIPYVLGRMLAVAEVVLPNRDLHWLGKTLTYPKNFILNVWIGVVTKRKTRDLDKIVRELGTEFGQAVPAADVEILFKRLTPDEMCMVWVGHAHQSQIMGH
jgi:hypothetical protein